MADAHDRLTLSLDGELARLTRVAALADQLSVDEWVAQVLGDRLASLAPAPDEAVAVGSEPSLLEPAAADEAPMAASDGPDLPAEEEPEMAETQPEIAQILEAEPVPPEAVEAEPEVAEAVEADSGATEPAAETEAPELAAAADADPPVTDPGTESSWAPVPAPATAVPAPPQPAPSAGYQPPAVYQPPARLQPAPTTQYQPPAAPGYQPPASYQPGPGQYQPGPIPSQPGPAPYQAPGAYQPGPAPYQPGVAPYPPAQGPRPSMPGQPGPGQHGQPLLPPAAGQPGGPGPYQPGPGYPNPGYPTGGQAPLPPVAGASVPGQYRPAAPGPYQPPVAGYPGAQPSVPPGPAPYQPVPYQAGPQQPGAPVPYPGVGGPYAQPPIAVVPVPQPSMGTRPVPPPPPPPPAPAAPVTPAEPAHAAEPAASGPARSLAESLLEQAAWQQVTDATETFLILLPAGWNSRAWVEPTPVMAYPMAQATSPDGGTTLFSGDSGIPMFLDPANSRIAPPGMALRPPTQATDFLSEWVRFRYGMRPGFQQLELRDDQELREIATQTVQRLGSPLTWLYAARFVASYTGEDGRLVRGVFLATTRGVGPGWIAQVYGVTSVEDPEPFVPAVLKLVATGQATTAQALRNQQEQARIAASHRAVMTMIDTNARASAAAHEQRMGDIAQQGRAFQDRMQEQQRSNDEATAAWRAQQASSDEAHEATMGGLRTGAAQPGAGGTEQQGIINAIREETTVLDAHGDAHQLEAGADRYYHDEYNNTWVGLQEHQDIVEETGNDNFREGTIQS